MRFSPFIILSISALGSDALWANPSRDEFQAAYSKQLKSNQAIFNTAPVYHIVPKQNTVTFAGEYRYYDVRIVDPGINAGTDTDQLYEHLDMAGWSVSPYLAFSAKRFGFGFSAEVGKRSAHYLLRSQSGGSTSTSTSTSTYEQHLGEASYSGLGFNLFFIPAWSVLPKYVIPTLIVGGKSLNVKHSSSGTISSAFQASEMTNYQYAVQNYQAGCNVNVKFLKNFSVIPWFDYSSFRLGTPELSAGASGSTPVAEDPTVSDDAEFFWKSAPALTYGIDFTVALYGINVHLGSTIGFLGTLNKGSDRIQDKSRSINISIDVKGK